MSHFYICNTAMSRGCGRVSHVWVKKVVFDRYGPHLLLQHVSSVAHIWHDDSHSLVKFTLDARWQSLLQRAISDQVLVYTRRCSHVIKCCTILNFFFVLFYSFLAYLQPNYWKIIFIVFTSIFNVFQIISITYIFIILIIPYFTISWWSMLKSFMKCLRLLNTILSSAVTVDFILCFV